MPTAADSGVLPGYEAYSWVGLLAPAGTPAPVVAHLNAECCASLANPTVRAAMEPRAWPNTAGWLRLRLFGDRISMLMPFDWKVLPSGELDTRVRIAFTQSSPSERPGAVSCTVKSAAAEATAEMIQAALAAHVMAKPLNEAAGRRSPGEMASKQIRENGVD